MIGKLIKNPAFQSLLSKLMVLYLVYIRAFTIIGLFKFKVSDAARLAGDMVIFAFFLDLLISQCIKTYLFIAVSLKNIKTGENTTIYYRDSEDIKKVILTVLVKNKSKPGLKFIKYLLKKDKIIIKLKWSHDTWLSFNRVEGLLSMDNDALFYSETDGICINLFEPISEDEEYAEIINTPLLMACDMGDKTEGQITIDIIYEIKNSIKRKIVSLLLSLWFEVDYKPHKVKIV